MSNQTTTSPPDTPPEHLTPEEVKALFGENAQPSEDRGMSAAEPILAEDVAAPTKGEDNPMHAIGPLPTDVPHPEEDAEVPLPSTASTYGAPPLDASFAMPGELGTPEIPPPPTNADLSPNPEVVAELISKKDFHALWQRADLLQEQIKQHINNLNRARLLLDEIRSARNYMLAGRSNYEEAARLLDDVEYQIAFVQRVRQASKTVGKWLLSYEIGMAFLLGAAMFVVPWFLDRYAQFFGYEAGTTGINSIRWLIDGFKTMFWGGLGGVTGALYALWRHVADKQDFDPQYSMWYITNPLMGFALGAFVYIAVQAGLFSLTAGNTSSIQTTAVPTFVLAWLSGFQQNVAYDIVRRMLKVFQIEEKETEPAVPTPHTTKK